MLAFFGGQRYSHEIHIYQKLINGYFKKVKGRRCRRSLFFVRYTKLFHMKRSYRTNIEQQNLLNQFLKEHGVQLSE